MIHYNLQCDKAHDFDGWFKDSSSFEQQVQAGEVTCPACGSVSVSKGLMAPNVATSKKKQTGPVQPVAVHGGKTPAELMDAMRQLRSQVEKTSDNVGDKFAEEARKIHYGEVEERGIYGKAEVSEIKELAEEGIETCPLPVLPEDKN